MKKLLLTSQGLPKELKQVFLNCLIKPPKENKVAFITTAAYGDNQCRPKWLDVYKRQLRRYGVKNIEELDLKDKTEKELEKILSDKDIIFVNGGNTFYLLFWIRKTGFDKIVKRMIRKGKLYIGISAGSYICCPTIEMSNWKHQDRNKIGLKDLTALNLVSFLVTAHFEEGYRPIIKKAAKTTKHPIAALNDTQAILVKNNKYRLVGKGKKEFFNNFKEKY